KTLQALVAVSQGRDGFQQRRLTGCVFSHDDGYALVQGDFGVSKAAHVLELQPIEMGGAGRHGIRIVAEGLLNRCRLRSAWSIRRSGRLTSTSIWMHSSCRWKSCSIRRSRASL